MIAVSPEEIEITMSELAVKQLKNILRNDYTLEGLCFRLKIDGKECHGFTYALGFTSCEPDDLVLNIDGITVHMDPFTGFYCKQGKIEYLFDMESNQEGFYFENLNENSYRGKFFKKENMTPKML